MAPPFFSKWQSIDNLPHIKSIDNLPHIKSIDNLPRKTNSFLSREKDSQ